MSRTWITGYRNYELGVFDEDSDKAKVIKAAIKEQMEQLIENGCDWIITGAQLGTEQWTVKIANDLKHKYPNQFKVAVILPFKNFGSNWNEANQARLQQVISLADFTANVSKEEYNSPQQLKNYQDFMLLHTDQALLLYDTDNEGKTIYDYNKIKEFMKQHAYNLQLIDLDDLQDMANEFQAQLNNDF